MLLNPAASRAVCPTPSVPALTSRASLSLFFVFLTPPAAPRVLPELPVSVCCLTGAVCESARSPVQVARQPPHARSRSSQSQSISSEHTGTLEFREKSGGTCSRLRVSFCCLVGAVASPPAPPCRWPTSCQPLLRAPGAPGLSLDPVSTPEFRSSVGSLVARAPGSRSQSAVSRLPPAVRPLPGAGGYRLSSDICARFHGSPLRTSILSAGDVHL